MSGDLRPCPGCGLLTGDYADARYTYPGALTEGGKYAIASVDDLARGAWRCGACVGKDTRAWRELGRPSHTARRPAGALLTTGEKWP